MSAKVENSAIWTKSISGSDFNIGNFYIGTSKELNPQGAIPPNLSELNQKFTDPIESTLDESNPTAVSTDSNILYLAQDLSKSHLGSNSHSNFMVEDSLIHTEQPDNVIDQEENNLNDDEYQFEEPSDNQPYHVRIENASIATEELWHDHAAPEGRWNWLVMLGSFVCMFAVDGVCFSYGMQISTMVTEQPFSFSHQGVNKSFVKPSLGRLSLPGSLMYGICFLIGPLAGALVNRFDYRSVAIVGALIATLSCFISGIYTHDLELFTIFFGLCGGIGCGLVYLPAITVVGYWFEEHRALIVGVAMCGGGLGTCTLALVTRWFVQLFSWHGYLILMAALFCQTLVGIALFRPIFVHDLIRSVQLRRLLEKADKKTFSRTKKSKIVEQCASSKAAKQRLRKIAIQRGSIMARIIEEKSRQRTTSTGSLDGMVITRENQLVALSSPDAYETALAAAAVYTSQQAELECWETVSQGMKDSTKMPKYGVNLPSETACFQDLQTVTEGIPMTSSKPATQMNLSLTNHVAILPPPVQFSRSAVRRIACAILRKLYNRQRLFIAPSITSTPADSHQALPPKRLIYEIRNESWSTFNNMGTTNSGLSNHMSSMNPVSTRRSQCDYPRNRISHCETMEIGMATIALRNKQSSKFASVSIGVNNSNNDNSDFDISAGLVENRSNRDSKVDPKLSTHSQLYSSGSASGRVSMISLDSRTDRIIAQELDSLRLDDQTKAAIWFALRTELSKPKYRLDLFYAGNKRKSPLKLYSPNRSKKCSNNLACHHNDAFDERTDKHKCVLRGSKSVTSTSCSVHSKVVNTQIGPKTLASEQVYLMNSAPRLANTHGPSGFGACARKPSRLTGTNELLVYLWDMLDAHLLLSSTFLVLCVACSINMLVLLVPFYYLNLLLEFGGLECHFNPSWCPPESFNATRHNPYSPFGFLDPNTYAFTSPELLLFTIGAAGILGRLIAAIYIEAGVNTNHALVYQCPCLFDPIRLNNVALLVSGLSVFCFPLAIHGIPKPKPIHPREIGLWLTDPDPEYVQSWSLDFRLWLIYVAGLLYGLASSMSISLRSVILVELFGIQHLTNAFGYLMIFQGLGIICGPPLFGALCNTACERCMNLLHQPTPPSQPSSSLTECTQQLMIAFYLCGALFIFTSLLFMPLRWLIRHDPYRSKFMRSQSTYEINLLRKPEDMYSLGSDFRNRDHQYDPQETQTTHILSDINSTNQPPDQI